MYASLYVKFQNPRVYILFISDEIYPPKKLFECTFPSTIHESLFPTLLPT